MIMQIRTLLYVGAIATPLCKTINLIRKKSLDDCQKIVQQRLKKNVLKLNIRIQNANNLDETHAIQKEIEALYAGYIVRYKLDTSESLIENLTYDNLMKELELIELITEE